MNIEHMDPRGTPSGKISISLHDCAIVAIIGYIICMMAFETNPDLGQYASWALYACLGFCFVAFIEEGHLKVYQLTIYLLIFGLCLSASYWYSPTSQRIKDMYLYRYWTSFLISFFVLTTVRTEKDVFVVLHGVILGGVVLAASIYMNYGIENLASSAERMGGEFGNQNILGTYGAYAVILAVYMMITRRKQFWFYVLAIVICLPLIMFTGSRKAILLVLAGAITTILSYSENRKLIRNCLMSIGVIVAMFWIIQNIPAFSAINERFSELVDVFGGEKEVGGSDQNRIDYVVKGWEYAIKNPILGRGLCYSHYVFRGYTHTNYMELFLNNGLLGFLLFYTNHWRLIRGGFAVRCLNKKTGSLVLTLMISILVCDIGVVTYYDRLILMLLCLCTRCIDWQYKMQEANAQELNNN